MSFHWTTLSLRKITISFQKAKLAKIVQSGHTEELLWQTRGFSATFAAVKSLGP